MRLLTVTNSAIDLQDQVVPFNPGSTVLVHNFTGGSLVLQESDASGSGFGTLATCGAGITAVTLNKQYIKVSTAANLFLIAE